MEYKKRNTYDITSDAYSSIKSKLKTFRIQLKSKICFLGFDGYIDSLYTLVKSRKDSKEYIKMDKMSTFGNIVKQAAGSATNIERILKKRTSGGFAPNTAKAMQSLGIKINLVAAVGYPEVKKQFLPFKELGGVDLVNFSNPGETLGLEFDDGKVLLPDFANIMNIDWDLLMDRVGLDNIISMITNSDLMGFGHWASLPYFNNIWTKMIDWILPSIDNLENKLFFVDLADLKKRKSNDIEKMLEILRQINDLVPVVLSLNDQEAMDICKLLDKVDIFKNDIPNHLDLSEGGRAINSELNLSYLVIHTPHFATISLRSGDHCYIRQGFTSKPKYTIGAGEYFNAGISSALCCGLDPAEALLIGNGITGIFIRTGQAPTFDQLIQFLKYYMEYIDHDISEFPHNF
jgi:hypothetical protein